MTARERTGPLDGLRVIDMSGMISGAFATTMMGDFGADVVMIEHPEVGDPIREWPQKTAEGESLSWKSLGRNKRCVTLDLGSDRGPEYPKRPDRIFKRSIRGMVPYKTPRGREAFEGIRVYMGNPYDDAEVLDDTSLDRLSNIKFVSLGDVSEALGASVTW